MTSVSLISCSGKTTEKEKGQNKPETETRIDTGFVVTTPDSFDSADTAVLVGKNSDDNTVTFLNIQLGKKYTLSYDGTTRFFDKHQGSVSLEQIKKGSIVDVTFLKKKKHLTTMQLSNQSFSRENIDNYEYDTIKGEISIGSEIYKLSKDIHYYYNEREIDLMDLNPTDIISFYGMGNTVLSAVVEKGHGYLRLKNDENFLGGWIEIGQNHIKKITEDMLYIVPEGTYQVNISYNGGGGIKQAVIRANEETTLDIGDLEIPKPQEGIVIVSVSPSNAEIYLDGDKKDVSAPITLTYGLHQLIARAEGYKSVTQYIRINQDSVGVNVELDKAKNNEDKDDEDEDKDLDSKDTDNKDSGEKDKDSTDNKDSEEKDKDNTDNKDSEENDKNNTDNKGSEEKDKNSTDNKGPEEKDKDSTDNKDVVNTDIKADSVTDYYKIYIDAPEKVEVYVDGNYIGVSPCSFRKVKGAHVITLRKTGMETRSYTVQVDDEKKDITYSFVDLIAQE